MRSAFILMVLASCAWLASACSRSAPPDFQPTATVKDIMDSVVDPNADFIWDSVEVVATLQGIEEKAPKTDEDWKNLRRHAISLLEASNLLLVPGRHVAKPGEKADDERVDLKPEEIEARDVKALLNAGDVLDQACETCHRRYWYRVAPASGVDTSERSKGGS